ncbi:hypothetical protein AB0D98_00445 [Streptomyces sp. NPDC047987]
MRRALFLAARILTDSSSLVIGRPAAPYGAGPGAGAARLNS